MLTFLPRLMVREIPRRPHSMAGYNSTSFSTCRESRSFEVTLSMLFVPISWGNKRKMSITVSSRTYRMVTRNLDGD